MALLSIMNAPNYGLSTGRLGTTASRPPASTPSGWSPGSYHSPPDPHPPLPVHLLCAVPALPSGIPGQRPAKRGGERSPPLLSPAPSPKLALLTLGHLHAPFKGTQLSLSQPCLHLTPSTFVKESNPHATASSMPPAWSCSSPQPCPLLPPKGFTFQPGLLSHSRTAHGHPTFSPHTVNARCHLQLVAHWSHVDPRAPYIPPLAHQPSPCSHPNPHMPEPSS